jgi:hypothetical protein
MVRLFGATLITAGGVLVGCGGDDSGGSGGSTQDASLDVNRPGTDASLGTTSDAPGTTDVSNEASSDDSGAVEASSIEASSDDSGAVDASVDASADASSQDTGAVDASLDGSSQDTGALDASVDGSSDDTGAIDGPSEGAVDASGNETSVDSGDAGDAGNVCPTCQTGLKLYWKFDEASGTTAADSSGDGFTGTYVSTIVGDSGMGPMPTPSANVPPAVAATFSDPFSLMFASAAGYRQAVQYTPTDATLQPANNLTVSVWFRSTTTGMNGSEVVSMGDAYLLRLKSTTGNYQLQFTKFTGAAYIDCIGPAVPSTVFMDGNWHHFAGIADGSTGLSMYLDGALVTVNLDGGSSTCSDPVKAVNTANIVYTAGRSFWVGRNGKTSANYDFNGNIDEVRVYNRVLSAAEIASLAHGAF